ncbi:MAG: hypothetical protein ACPG5B_08120 [Chitinophagales bacterium]
MFNRFIKKWSFVVVLFALIFAATSCTQTDIVPSYLQIDTITLDTYTQEGSSSHLIESVWTFVNGEPLGVYELPATIAVLAEGASEIVIRPGIKNNGISNTRVMYPFYQTQSASIELSASNTTTLNFETSYIEPTVFSFINDFEVSNNFESTDLLYAPLQVINEPDLVFEGTRSGAVYLNEVDTFFQIKTNVGYLLPDQNYPVYLEMNYRCNQTFQVLLRASNLQGASIIWSQLYVGKKENWNKIYIELTETATDLNQQDFDVFEVLFQATLADTLETAYFYWDNVKLLHYEQ